MRWTGSIGRMALVSVLTTTIALASAGLAASVAFGSFGLTKWEAGTCTNSACTISTPEEFYTRAGGHPPFGITDFALKTNGAGEPEGHIEEVRVDIPTGLAVDPLATPQCKLSQLEHEVCPPGSEVGKVQLTAHVGVEILGLKPGTTVKSEATVYNMEPPPGHPLEAAFKVAIFETIAHIVGGIEWSGSNLGAYHEYFTIKEIPTNPELIESRLIFTGTAFTPGVGTSPFITMPTICNGPQTSYVHVRSYAKEEDSSAFTTPVGASECDKIPFHPAVSVTPATTQSDRPDGATVKVEIPHNTDPNGVDDSTLKDAVVSLPEGMTLNPAAAGGLESCSDQQFHKGSEQPIECPAGSVIGTDTIETPDLPPGSLTGNVYVGQPLSNNPESGQEYRIFIAAQSTRYGVGVRLIGNVTANASTGRLTTAVVENPQVPFSDFILNFNSARNPLANPLACGPATTIASLVPYSGNPAAEPLGSFPVDFDGLGGACPAPLPFTLGQGLSVAPTTGGSSPTMTYSLGRGEGQQYVSKITTVLPPGLVGRIPAVTLCGEPQATSGDCPATSEIGTASVTVGSGPSPYGLSGKAFLTGPYGGAPYGLSVVVPAEKIGPYNYGKIVTRASVGVDPYSARIVVSSQLPTVVGGAPIRLRSLSVNVTHANFLLDPTNCEALSLDTTLTSTFGTTQSISTPFQASACSALPFKPKFTAATGAKTSRAVGAHLSTKIVFPKGPTANVKSVLVELPKQLPARISTLNLACREAVFAANPYSCPPGARVGTVTVATPVLPDKLTGFGVFVSHGGAAFPDLDLVLTGDGVTVILVGHTNIVKNVTSSNFASLPDVPVTSVEVKLPSGKKSALGGVGNMCKKPLLMPTTITGQNGKVLKQRTRIHVLGCPRKHHRKHHKHRHHRRSVRKASH